MAGPSVMVSVFGDLKGLGDAFKGAGTAAQSAAGTAQKAFSGMLGALNQTGVLGPFGDALDGIDRALETVAKHGKDIGPAMIGVGGALAGVGAGLAALGSKDQAAHQQLQASVEATGKSYDDYSGQVEEAIKHQEHFGDTAGQTQDALSKLTQATHDPQKALELLSTATNVAAAKHEDLSTAATQVGKVFNGNQKLLKEYGITVDKTTGLTNDHKTAMQALADVTAGQASAAADTFSGKLDGIKARLEDQMAAMGAKYGPAITGIGSALAGLGGAWSVISAIMAADWFAAFWPIGLIVLAIAAVGVAIYLMRDKFVAVFDWLKTNWPLILAILTGPFGVAVLEIKRHWGEITDFFKGLPGDIERIFASVWGGIETAFKDVLNAVIDLWNDLHFTLPKIDLGPLGKIGGGDIGVPHIPHLAQGGLVTQTGLIYAHAGEAITPMPGGMGPALHIENATFNSAVDVDLIAKRLEFAVGAGMRV